MSAYTSEGIGPCAFRLAEKHFQHLGRVAKPATNRERKRNAKAGHQAPPAADLAAEGVLDVRAPAVTDQWVTRGALVPHSLALSTRTNEGPGAVTLPSDRDASATSSSRETPCPHSEHSNGSTFSPCSQHSVPPSSTCSSESPAGQPTVAYTLPAHPGFVLLPALLPVAHQLQLMCDALTRFPEPPATTNHNRQYGPVTGIWTAAQHGLHLKLSRLPEAELSSAQAVSKAKSDLASRGFWDCWHPPAAQPQPVENREGQQQQEQVQQQHDVQGPSDQHTPPHHHDHDHHQQQQQQQQQYQQSVSAAVMLRRMRWATLGPQFDWTRRVYDGGILHRPLPPSLEHLARSTATLVDQLTLLHTPPASQPLKDTSAQPNSAPPCTNTCTQPAHPHTPPASPPLKHSNTHPDNCAPPSTTASTHGSSDSCQGAKPGKQIGKKACTPAMSRGMAEACHAGNSRPFQPDAALVNYYYEGDTLGGHCDDVEADLALPIVAASIGCDAVFLMGGPTRDHPPTPVLLRSGDVVVLGGPARNCFHGVPRVFADRPLPFSLDTALDALPPEQLAEMAGAVLQQCPPELKTGHAAALQSAACGGPGCREVLLPVLRHMQTCRVNISVRAVR